MENDMDIGSVRLGFAYAALRQALGEDFAPVSFAEHSMVFVDRRRGLTHFCTATREALWVGLADATGRLGNGSDEQSLNLRARSETTYLSLARGFERELDSAMSREARAAHEASVPQIATAKSMPASRAVAPMAARQAPPRAIQTTIAARPEQARAPSTEAKPWAPATVRASRPPVRLGPAAKA